LFFYREKLISIDFLYQSFFLIEELDSKQRKIKALRGFFLYALEMLNNEKDLEILTTNLKTSFW
jgi:hypothetical protein